MKLTVIDAIKRIQEVHGDSVSLIVDTYVNTITKCSFIDKEYGIWQALPEAVFRGGGHPKKRIERIIKKQRMSLEEIRDRLKTIHGNNVNIEDSTYISTHKPAKFIDSEYGEWWAHPANVIRGSCHKKRYNNSQKRLKITADDVESKLKIIFNNEVSLDKSTYHGITKKATFIDINYGPWEAIPDNVINKKTRHPDLGFRNARRTATKTYIVEHWKTGHQVFCTGSYEFFVVKYFNQNKIDYIEQPKTFTTSLLRKDNCFKKYTPDFYLPKRDLWIEVKGWFRPNKDSKDKWVWFSNNYPNSELWDKNKLKELKII